MQRFVTTLACGLVLAAGPAMAQAAKKQPPKAATEKTQPANTKAEPTKTVRGSITAIAGDSITVKTSTGDMTFTVDSKTHVIEPGGSTKTRAAQAEGKAGLPVTEALKTGQTVEVKYHEQGMHAASIRTIGSMPAGSKSSAAGTKASAAAAGGEAVPAGGAAKTGTGAAAKAQTATGTVSSISGSSLTIKGASGDTTFTVDEKTIVSGTGVGTKARTQEATGGGKPTLTEFVHEGDAVAVTYHDMGGTKHASVVRITKKKM